MKIEIWSDIVCPFCYIGKRRFEEALAEFKEKDKVQVEWKSFLLDPHAETKDGKKIYEVLAEKKGWSIEYAKKANAQVTEMAKQAGLNFDFDSVIPANSFLAHRLAHLAAKHDLQDLAEEELFKAYFTEGKNINDKEVLTIIGINIGLPKNEVRSLFETDEFTQEVKTEAYEAEQIGVRGVPFFVIDRKYSVSGAQPKDVFASALATAWKEREVLNPIPNEGTSNSCSPDGKC